MDAFGAQMLSSDGADHVRYRMAAQGAFSPKAVRADYEEGVQRLTYRLLNDLSHQGGADLRSAFASRLPVQVMLAALDLPPVAESDLRTWYDVFEARLADPLGDPEISARAKAAAAAFRAMAGAGLPHAGARPLLPAVMTTALGQGAITQDEAERNLSVIFFGGISTVEALILNTLYALFSHPLELAKVRADLALVPLAVEETMRWLSPVQSASRAVVADTEFCGVQLKAGEKISAMLGSANRDPTAFADPDVFRLGRTDANRHLGFATGPHLCLGLHLARAQAAIALRGLFDALPGLWVDVAACRPQGFEFRQPRSFLATWTPSGSWRSALD
jgi:cytochrome P450